MVMELFKAVVGQLLLVLVQSNSFLMLVHHLFDPLALLLIAR